MKIARYISRQLCNTLFRLTSQGIVLEGKGIVKRIKSFNKGNGNNVLVEAGASLTNCRFFFKGNNNSLHIACGTHLKNVTFWFEDDNNSIKIGQMVTSEGELELAACESTNITIGDDCMFSYGIHVRTTDSHSIYDESNHRLNPADDITIGNHVWIGADSMVLKGSNIPNGSVVGARSIVTSSLKIKENSMFVGAPAKVIKENISWKR